MLAEKIKLKFLALYVLFLELRYRLLKPYFSSLAIQARFLYRQSDLFKNRYQQLGLEAAEKLFEKDAISFFKKAQKEPLIIRLQLFFDATFGREQRAYYK
jgi:hypothetical protein